MQNYKFFLIICYNFEKLEEKMEVLEIILTLVCAYLIGSILTGYLIVKSKTGQDIRQVGSGSTGATNVKRVLGKKWFFIVLLLDAFKGALPVVLAKIFTTSFASIVVLVMYPFQPSQAASSTTLSSLITMPTSCVISRKVMRQ